MQEWLISVPVWGERYLRIFEQATLPALRIAIERLQRPYTIIVHTDSPKSILLMLGDLRAVIKDVPPPDNSFMSLSNAHREVLSMAKTFQRVCLLTSDLVLSPNSLAFCEEKLDQRYKLICCMGMRVCEEELPPQFETGRELLEWGWDHRHPMTKECTWPDGKSYDVWRMYFDDGQNVCCRLLLPHPIAILKDRQHITFQPTIDVNVITNYRPKDIYVVQEPNELAMIELSPKDKEFLVTVSMHKRYMTQGASTPSFIRIRNPHHRHMLAHRIVIKGENKDCGESAVIQRMTGA